MLVALDYYDSPRREVVIAGPRDAPLTKAFLGALRARFLPRTIALLIDSDETRSKLATFSRSRHHARNQRPTHRLRLPKLRLPAPHKRAFQV